MTDAHPVVRTPADSALVVGATAPRIKFGITFDLNGTLVPVTADDLANAKANGVELRLPNAVKLGSFNDFSAWFKQQFEIDIPSPSELPSPLDKVLGKLTSLEVTITKAHLKIPGDRQPDARTVYTLELSAEWPQREGGIPLVPGVTIVGGVFGVTNEPPVSPQLA